MRCTDDEVMRLANTLLVYATTDGHTRTISLRLAEVMEAGGDSVTVLPIGEAGSIDLSGYEKIVIGASIRYGKHGREVTEFIARYLEDLRSRPSAFFSVNLVARKPEKNQPDTNPYVKRFLHKIPWKPDHVAVFAGKLDYPRYTPLDRWIIRAIMWITKGPTDPTAVVEFTDWGRVDAFGRHLASLTAARAGPYPRAQ